MQLSDFDYNLPPASIAQFPAEPRDHSKLLVVNREQETLEDHRFFDLVDILTQRDVLVINDTKVFPARLYGKKGEKSIEILLLKEIEQTSTSITWEVITKPGLKLHDMIHIPNTEVVGICIEIHEYTRRVRFSTSREHFFALLFTSAKTPIPPYIHWESGDEQTLREKYQTVYAKNMGAVAAPTAGLHFTPELLEKLRKLGVTIASVTLHVGAGTFLPVKTENIMQHHMHEEWFELSSETADLLNEAKSAGKRIIAVGTTSVRVLETSTSKGVLVPKTGTTQIFIYPPYLFQFVDALITNFHTPKSTLLMLISAFASFPNTTKQFTTFKDSLMGKAYYYALGHAYRFYSFGDAMFIV